MHVCLYIAKCSVRTTDYADRFLHILFIRHDHRLHSSTVASPSKTHHRVCMVVTFIWLSVLKKTTHTLHWDHSIWSPSPQRLSQIACDAQETKGSDISADQNIGSSSSHPLEHRNAGAIAELSQLPQEVTNSADLTSNSPAGEQQAAIDSAAADETAEFVADSQNSLDHQSANVTVDASKEPDPEEPTSPVITKATLETANNSSAGGVVVPVYAPLGSLTRNAVEAW